jgi:small nuclear ribonucleoprotein (snRNP)-like protein
VVLRDHDGRTYGGQARWYDHCLNALSTEAMVSRDGVQYAQEREVQRLQLETDCQVLVKLWENRSCQNSEVGHPSTAYRRSKPEFY